MKCLTILKLALGTASLSGVGAGSWMTCPVSFNPSPRRKPELIGPCEMGILPSEMHSTYLYAGDRLKVGWVSNNHAGGFVRIALVPLKERYDRAAFDRSIIKATCFGHDTHAGNSTLGFCNHPCGARGGCEYQVKRDDIHRYDTTVAIPTNIDDGFYVLQWMGISSDNQNPAYSCSLLHIQGGSSRQQNCDSPALRLPTCAVAPGGMSVEKFLEGSHMGSFCYNNDDSTDVDVSIGALARNYNCDPRQTCQIAFSPEGCQARMTEPSFPRNPLVQCPLLDKLHHDDSTAGSALIKDPLNQGAKKKAAHNGHKDEVKDEEKSVLAWFEDKMKEMVALLPTPTPTPTLPTSTIEPPTTTLTLGGPISTSTIIVLPYQECDAPPEDYVCYGSQLARCVNHFWSVFNCPSGFNCFNARCVFKPV